MKHHDDWEDVFSQGARKENKKERYLTRSKDRSQFKKTDIDQKKKQEASLPLSEKNGDEGRVLAILPEGALVDSEGEIYLCSLKGSLKQHNLRTKNLVAVGDFVCFEKGSSSTREKTGVITHVQERKSLLSRADNLSRNKEQLIAVNIDQVFITCSVLEPPLKPSLVDRYIIAAEKGGMTPLIVITKIDLFNRPLNTLSFADKNGQLKEMELYTLFLETYQTLGIPLFPVSLVTGQGLSALTLSMKGKASVFSGQSGTGKTSLINAITGSNLRTGFLSQHTLKGSHTTTSSMLLPLKGGGFCIDTPGIRSFGMWDLEIGDIESYFSEIFAEGRNCRFSNCRHLEEPFCAVKKAVEEKIISSLRFDSYTSLMKELSKEHRSR